MALDIGGFRVHQDNRIDMQILGASGMNTLTVSGTITPEIQNAIATMRGALAAALVNRPEIMQQRLDDYTARLTGVRTQTDALRAQIAGMPDGQRKSDLQAIVTGLEAQLSGVAVLPAPLMAESGLPQPAEVEPSEKAER